jgi:hypothetical protein
VAPHSPMKILHSKKKVEGFEHRIFSLDDVYWKLDEAAVLDPKFRKALAKSLDEQGMLWPPIVWTHETYLAFLEEGCNNHDSYKDLNIAQKYRVSLGNNRFEYAHEKGYTHIECVVANNWTERKTILDQTIMEYRKDF